MTNGDQYDRIKPVPTYERVDAQCGQIVLDFLSTERMRELRLYHWDMVVLHRKRQEDHEYNARSCKNIHTKVILETKADNNKGIANFHLGAVQLLNQFFPIGDYAENDVKTG